MLDILTQIDNLKNQSDKLCPLNAGQLKNLLEAWDIDHAYKSNR